MLHNAKQQLMFQKALHIQHIGNSSFKRCIELKHLSLPNVLSIDDNAFAENQLEDVKIGSKIKRIGSNSFYSSNQTLTRFTADVLSSSLEDVAQCWPFGIDDESVIHFNREAEEIIIPPVPSNAKIKVAENVVKHDLYDEGQTYSDDTKLATLDLTHIEGALNAEDITFPEGDVPFVAYFNDNLTAVPKIDVADIGIAGAAFEGVHENFKIYVNSSIYNEMTTDTYWDAVVQ